MNGAPQTGVYVLQIRLASEQRIAVGSLGVLRFPAGIYLYVGRALRALPSRLLRHTRKNKPLRWHIDYLTRHARVTRVWVWPPVSTLECSTAAALAARMSVIRGFGSSDCRCRGHLFHDSTELGVEHLPQWQDVVWTCVP